MIDLTMREDAHPDSLSFIGDMIDWAHGVSDLSPTLINCELAKLMQDMAAHKGHALIALGYILDACPGAFSAEERADIDRICDEARRHFERTMRALASEVAR